MKKTKWIINRLLVLTLLSGTIGSTLPVVTYAEEVQNQVVEVQETNSEEVDTQATESTFNDSKASITQESEESFKVKDTTQEEKKETTESTISIEETKKDEKKESKKIPVQILGINDFHGALSSTGTATLETRFSKVGKSFYLASEFNAAEAKFKAANPNGESIRVQAGDLVGASPSNSSLLQDEPTIKAMNRMNIEYGILGNHEFDEGLDEFDRIIKGGVAVGDYFNSITQSYPKEPSNMEILSANIFDQNGNIPKDYKPYAIKEIGSGEDKVKIGFIGVVTEEIPNLVLRKHVENYTFTDPAQAIAENAKLLRKEGVNAIVVIGHTGAAQNGSSISGETAQIIDSLNSIDPEHSVDAYFAGHSHSYANAEYNGVRVIQSTAQGKAFADVIGEIDVDTKDFVSAPSGVVKPVLNDESAPVSTLIPDQSVKGLVDEADTLVKTVTQEVIGKSTTKEMISRQVNNGNDQESAVGNLITDGQLNEARKENFEGGVHFAMTNNGGIRDDLRVDAEGNITWGAAQAVQPFGNIMQVVSIKGADIVEALNQQFKEFYFLQIAGMRYTYTGEKIEEKDESGKVIKTTDTRKVKDVFEVTAEGKEIPLDLEKNYNVVINDFLFGGGDGFKAFTKGTLLGALNPDTDIFVKYIKELGNVSAKVEGRKKPATDSKEKQLTIIGTTDVHGNLWDFSYEDNQQKDLGLAKVSGYVNEVRGEKGADNVVLIDSGDMIQGTIMTDELYNVKENLQKDVHPMISGMNYMKYDSMTLGNHEFNFTLDLIKKIEKDANFPILSANTYVKETGKNFVGNYKMVKKDGLNVAILGLTIPDIPHWESGKVDSLEFIGLQKEAEKQVKIIKEKENADVIVASIHAGLNNSKPESAAKSVIENVSEIDAYLIGHDHATIATHMKDKNGIEKPIGASRDTGVQASRIDLNLEQDNQGKWNVKSSNVINKEMKGVPTDSGLLEATKQYHETTIEFINAEIGQASADFLPTQRIKGIPEAQMQPTALISLINNVQLKAMDADISAAALFQASSDLPKGPITYSNIFNIYKYANTLVGVNITGSKLKQYMEKQAEYYNQYQAGDLTISFGGPKEGNSKIRAYDYDMFVGVDYKIDVSKPVGERIVDLTYQGKPIKDDQTFKLAVNNHRFSGLVSSGIVKESDIYKESDPVTLRNMIVDYIRDQGTINPEDEIHRNWEIIGAPDLNHYVKPLVAEKINNGEIVIESSPNGRTPNINTIRISDLLEQGILTESDLNKKSFSVLHTNDMHGRMAPEYNADKTVLNTIGMAKLKTFKDQEMPTLMLDAGDAVQGLPLSNFSKGADMVKAMNAVGYDAMAVGNHEFDFSYERAMEIKDELNFPILAANIYKDGKRSFQPYTHIEKQGMNFLVIGLTTPETYTKTHPNNIKGVDFEDPIPEAKKAIKEAKAEYEKVDFDQIVFVTHLGIDGSTPEKWRSTGVAKALDEDPELKAENIMFVDGHSHTPMQHGQEEGRVKVVQAGDHMKYVGKVDVKQHEAPSVYDAKLIPAKEFLAVPENPKVKEIVDNAIKNFDDVNKEVLVKDNPYLLNGVNANVRTRETNLGNLLADGIYHYAQTGFSKPADFSIINGGGIRANLEKGDITKGDVITVLPFGNIISQVEIKGADIYKMFEVSVRSDVVTEDGKVVLDENGLPKLGRNGGFLQISDSIRFNYDSNKQGLVLNKEGTGAEIEGERVFNVEIRNQKTGKFEAVDNNKTYYVATNDFLAAGGDGYYMLGGNREEGPSLDAVFSDFLKNNIVVDEKVTREVKIPLSNYKEELPAGGKGTRIISKVDKEAPVTLNLVELDKAIVSAEKEKEADYTAASWKKFATALTEAKKVQKDAKVEDTKVTQAEVDKATTNLTTAQKELVNKEVPTKLNLVELDKAIVSAEKEKEADYTAASWKKFATALTEAKKVQKDAKVEDTKVTQAEVDKATTNLTTAQKELVNKEVPTKLNLVELDKAIVSAEKEKEADYTAASWKKFATALTEAKKVQKDAKVEDTKVTQAEVDKATTNLTTAQKELVKKGAGNGNNNGGTGSGSNGSGSTNNGKTTYPVGKLPKTGETESRSNVIGLVLLGTTAVSAYYVFRKRDEEAA
ncbi:5'-nucleotidase C-terminal domain-containing protein [Vagococcus fluvialis]|uniref:5'-nucleotidase C-terminal domain-containing protein n=2 Tax=Vagococcus fluvialis TaxID=2738 RepID=UPI002B2EA460|nr:5'-nucleotidase C-terminal domain-containing protein [Vagococcus fluvialis]